MGLSFYAGGKLQAPEIITKTKTTTVTKTVIDTVRDTTYVEVIPEVERDTVYILPDNIADNYINGFRNISSSYSDSMLIATHFLQIEQKTGNITQTYLNYILRQRLVRDRQVNLTTNIYTTTTTTRTIQEGLFFQGGIITNLDYFTPVIGVTTRNKITFLYGYDPFTKTHTAGVLAKF